MKMLIAAMGISLVLTISLAAAQPTTGPSTQPATPINKFCAVDRENKIDPKVTWTYQGKVIGFCCPDCIPMFKKDPEKYLKGLK